MEELVDNINRDVAGVTATLNSDGGIALSNDTGSDIVVGGTDVSNTGLTAGTYTGYIALTDDNNEAIEITVTDGSASTDLNGWGFNVSTGSDDVTGGAVTAVALDAGDLVINGVDVGAVAGTSAGDKAAAINAVSDQTGVSATAETTHEFALDFTAIPTDAAEVTFNGTAVDLTGATNLSDVVDAINGTVQGIVASATDGGALKLTSASGLDIVTDGTEAAAFLGEANTTFLGSISLSSDNGSDIVITGEGEAKAGFAEQGGSDAEIGSGLSVETVANANVAIERIDDALNNIANQRGNLGALQNRLDSTISNLGSVAENLTAANSRILDADFASETAAMTKAQVMSQAGTAMLAQANQLPQSVLSLLQ